MRKTEAVDNLGIWGRVSRLVTGVQEHRVTYMAAGVMGNKYKVLTAEFTSTRAERRAIGIPNLGFGKYRGELERHYRGGSDGMIHYWVEVE